MGRSAKESEMAPGQRLDVESGPSLLKTDAPDYASIWNDCLITFEQWGAALDFNLISIL
jgi:hypothetical protein